jgi:hypothetical protein
LRSRSAATASLSRAVNSSTRSAAFRCTPVRRSTFAPHLLREPADPGRTATGERRGAHAGVFPTPRLSRLFPATSPRQELVGANAGLVPVVMGAVHAMVMEWPRMIFAEGFFRVESAC